MPPAPADPSASNATESRRPGAAEESFAAYAPPAGVSKDVARLLEEINTTLSRGEREDLLSEIIDKSPADMRLEALSTLVERLTPTQRASFFSGALDHVLRYAHSAVVRKAMVAAFKDMLTEEQEHVLAALMGTVPTHRRADALNAFLDGTSREDELGSALAAGLIHVGPKARRRTFKVLSQSDLDIEERGKLAAILSLQRPGFDSSSCQTDLTFAEADGRLKASLIARDQTESARIGEWEQRAKLRMSTYREALARLDAARTSGAGADLSHEVPLLYRSVFGTMRPPVEPVPLEQLLGVVAEVFADKAANDELFGRHAGFLPLPMPTFLCSRVDNTPQAMARRSAGAACTTRQELSNVIAASTKLVAQLKYTEQDGVGGPVQRVALFAHAASFMNTGDDAGDAAVQRLLVGVYGPPNMMRKLMALTKVVVMITRESADTARINADPKTLVAYPPKPNVAPAAADDWDLDEDDDENGGTGENGGEKAPPLQSRPLEPPPVVSWGCVRDALEMSELPPHLQQAALAQAERQCAFHEGLTHVDDPRGIDSDELLEIILSAWKTLRRQQAEVLRERFYAADGDKDGFLTVPEFWACLQSLLKTMVFSGGAAEAAAEPWLARGEAELLYNQVLVESDFLAGTFSTSRPLAIACEGFVAVMMRRRLYDADFSHYLERHPEERLALK